MLTFYFSPICSILLFIHKYTLKHYFSHSIFYKPILYCFMCLAVFHYMHVCVSQWTWLVPIEVRRGNQKLCPRRSCTWLYAAMLDLGIEAKYIPWVVSAVSQWASHISSPIISILTCIIYYICVLKLFMLTIFNRHDIII